MTDDLKAAEDAAHELVWRAYKAEHAHMEEERQAVEFGYDFGFDQGYQAGDSDTRDAIIARRDAEVSALEFAMRNAVTWLDGYLGPHPKQGFRADSAIYARRVLEAALAKEVGQ